MNIVMICVSCTYPRVVKVKYNGSTKLLGGSWKQGAPALIIIGY